MDSVQQSHMLEIQDLSSVEDLGMAEATTIKTSAVAHEEVVAAIEPRSTHIEIFTDGSCIGNPGHGGWGAVTLRRELSSGEIIESMEGSGHEVRLTTNVKMEMTAACSAIESLGCATDEPITVFCDLDLIPKAMTLWLPNWKAKGWKKSGGKTVENRDLWERLERAADGRNVTWAWVRGHNGSEHNERADRLAYAASMRAEAIINGH